ncbi:MAG: histidine phosphatase family protein [Alysiella sp.]|uniref:histidine phosphatase family protein n=1 Tax=Alysiella sp. TaxID=1872483 RepID=UPI0026DAD20E|nr:histidine phosphatase family protein [Alysiella sp.]MDO4432969.1 histidine phosphatase family protein [Alysiella sp.]
MNIYLVRHGQTEYNLAGRIQGWCDSPLTETGKAGAVEMGKRLAQAKIVFDAAFCSTSPRTHHTAKLILQHTGQKDLPITPIAELREYHFGAFEGKIGNELHDLLAKKRGFATTEQWLHAYRNGSRNLLAEILPQLDPNGTAESETAFLQRLQHGLHQVIGQNRPDARVLVVSHGMAIAALVKAIAPDATRYISPPNASATLLHFDVLRGLQLIGEIGGAI